ncbi:MAG: hypothetical protein EBU90_20005 [Proteobacteria bacterium]|nr:hypothetical protein [Pseudomonadota bacterium]
MSVSDRQVICLITGQSLVMGKDYFEKKAIEYGSIDNLKTFYISKKAKQLIQRGYSVLEIRKILNAVEPGLVPENDQRIKELLAFHKAPSTETNRRLESGLNFSMQSSDEDVASFINNIRNISL